METFDFCVRLEDLIVGCCAGGNTPVQLQHVLVDTIKKLQPGGTLYNEIHGIEDSSESCATDECPPNIDFF